MLLFGIGKNNKKEDTFSRVFSLALKLEEKVEGTKVEFIEYNREENPPIADLYAEYSSIIQLWKSLISMKLLYYYKDRSPEKEILNIFKPYTNQKLQENTNSLSVMISNLEILESFLDKIIKQLKDLKS